MPDGILKRGTGLVTVWISTPARATAPVARFLELHSQVFTVVKLPVQTADGGPCLVTFHFHEAETPATPGENVSGDLDRTHGAER